MTLFKRVRNLENLTGLGDPDLVFIKPSSKNAEDRTSGLTGDDRIFGCAKAFIQWPDGKYTTYFANSGESYEAFQKRVCTIAQVKP